MKCTVYSGRMAIVRPSDTNRWVARYALAAVVLLGIYLARIQIIPNRVSPAHGSNSTMMMLFTVTFHCFVPSGNTSQPSDRLAVRISLMVCLFCALEITVHVLIDCRAAHSVIRLFCPIQQQFRVLPVTVFIIWLTLSSPFPNMNIKHWSEDMLVEGSVGSWAVLGQIELLTALYLVFLSLPSLLKSILTRLTFLSVLVHVQLVTCVHNSRVATKYELFIKITGLI